MKTQYLSLECLAATLDLPKNYLRNLAKNHKIPQLVVGGRLRFQEKSVREALSQIERQHTKEAKRTPTILSFSRTG